jgi:trigger factor
MKTECIDVSETQKTLVVEIPSDVVDAEIDRVTRHYGRAVRLPGFRPGRVPPQVVRQRFRDQILKEVAQELIPPAVATALRERGHQPIESPDIREVSLQEGQALTFTAAFETLPAIDPGDYGSITVRKPPAVLETTAVDDALERLRDRAARIEPVESRASEKGDLLTLDMDHEPDGERAEARAPGPTRQENVTVEIGAPGNPPGLDDQLSGLRAGDQHNFVIQYPDDHASSLAGRAVRYRVTVRDVKRKMLADLDDAFAREVGPFETLDDLRQRIRQDLLHQAEREADRQMRGELLDQLAGRVTFPVPPSLVEREIDRRATDLARRLMEQRIDPAKANVNWEQFRERMRESATQAVRSTLVLDEVARREQITVTEEDVTAEIERFAAESGRAPAAVRARLEKDGGLAAIQLGLRRERAVDFLLSHATIATA